MRWATARCVNLLSRRFASAMCSVGLLRGDGDGAHCCTSPACLAPRSALAKTACTGRVFESNVIGLSHRTGTSGMELPCSRVSRIPLRCRAMAWGCGENSRSGASYALTGGDRTLGGQSRVARRTRCAPTTRLHRIKHPRRRSHSFKGLKSPL
jgi:hypothetical protein